MHYIHGFVLRVFKSVLLLVVEVLVHRLHLSQSVLLYLLNFVYNMGKHEVRGRGER